MLDNSNYASAILRAEQDMAYEDALQDDRERLAAIEHATTVEQEALRISELEIKQYKMDLLKKKEWCDTNHASVGFPTANIRFQLPHGEKLQRTFSGEDPLQVNIKEYYDIFNTCF